MNFLKRIFGGDKAQSLSNQSRPRREAAVAPSSLPTATEWPKGDIHDAARNGDLEMVKALLKHNPDLVFRKDDVGWTPLHKAAYKGQTEAAKLLLANKAKVNASDNNCATPLHLAAQEGHKDVAELLLGNQAEPDAKDNTGGTPLHSSAFMGHKDVAELLLAYKANVNAKNHGGWTPLQQAAFNGQKGLAELLLANKADVDAKDSAGQTPLLMAAAKGHKNVVELLIASKADVNVMDKGGWTPSRWAARYGHEDVAELLRQHGDQLSCTSSPQRPSIRPIPNAPTYPTAVQPDIPSGSKGLQVGELGSDWAPGQPLLDDFVVERIIGEGGMGKVFLVRSRSTGSKFAVKCAKGLGEANRRNFLAELRTWSDLPEHANLVPCRFFRTLGDQVLIFTEYVEGGSLKDWIDSHNLYAGETKEALERMLDIAIQFAWGLHCLHELGLIHQDVKPANVLMDTQGKPDVQGVKSAVLKPMVTDFGLARARAAAGEIRSTDPGHSVLISSGGGTPAYWSPEQAEGLGLSRKTDIWSWGVSVLEMFTGEATWMSGTGAAAVLEEYLHKAGHVGGIPAMPDGVAGLLGECFRQNPDGRPKNLAEVVERLRKSYLESSGEDYARPLNVIKQTGSPQTGIPERRDDEGGAWTSPQEWLLKALRAAGRTPEEAATVVAQTGMTRRGELVAEIAVYDEAKRLYARLVQDGRKELEIDLATLCTDKALVHRTAADPQGALQECDQAIAIWHRLVNQDGRRELARRLAASYLNKGALVKALGDNRSAVALYDKAIAIQERLVNQEGRGEMTEDLALSYQNKALVISAFGDNRSAVALYDQAIAIQARLVNQEGRRELAHSLARTQMNKAGALSELGDTRGAVAFYDQAITAFERLVNQEGRRDVADILAASYQNKAGVVRDLGDNLGAVVLYDRAIAIQEQLVNQEGRRELARHLGGTFQNKANALNELGDSRGAVESCDQAIAIQERLVNLEGHRELAQELGGSYQNKAVAVSALGDNRRAVALCDQALAIWERLVNQEGRREFVRHLALTRGFRGENLITLGEREKGLQDIRSAQGLFDGEFVRTGAADLKGHARWCQQQLAKYA